MIARIGVVRDADAEPGQVAAEVLQVLLAEFDDHPGHP
jgi:hypothetical protein